MVSLKKMQIDRMGRFYPAIFTAAGSFVVYILTLEREVNWGDSAELALQAYWLGVTHPTGYPVHTLVGKLFTLFFSEPAIATNLLSAICTSLAVGVMSLIILDLTEDIFTSLFVPLFFAFTPLTWSMAVTTEIYNVNLLFFGVSLFLVLRYYKRPSLWKVLGCSLVFGLSLGVHLLNVILLPFFLFLIYRADRRLNSIIVFILGVFFSGVAILSFSYFRAQEIAPLGTQYVPTTLTNYWNYLTCNQCDVVTVFEASYYVERALEHARIVFANYAYLGILLGILGLVLLWLERRELAIVFALIVGLELGYLTTYQSWEYYNMAGPAHFVFTLSMAFCGRLPKIIIKVGLTQLAGGWGCGGGATPPKHPQQ